MEYGTLHKEHYMTMEQVYSTPAHHLPSIHSPARSSAEERAPPRPSWSLGFSLPHLTAAATKADRYSDLKKFDRKGVQRAKAHVRNALKTTADLSRIENQLNKRLRALGRQDKTKVSFNHLSLYRDAFEEIVRTSKAYKSSLKQIKDVYNEHLMAAVSNQQEHEAASSAELEALSVETSHFPATKDIPADVLKLKKQLHSLEVKSRVLLQENDRLKDELIKEKELFARHKEEEIAYLDSLKNRPVSPPKHDPDQDYATQVEVLQLQISNEKEAIAKVISKRKGRIPLSVCHHLEQCLREVEIESQKCQRHSEHLMQEIEKWKGTLWEQLQAIGCTDDFRDIWENVVTN